MEQQDVVRIGSSIGEQQNIVTSGSSIGEQQNIVTSGSSIGEQQNIESTGEPGPGTAEHLQRSKGQNPTHIQPLAGPLAKSFP
jgi:hypothetical protein